MELFIHSNSMKIVYIHEYIICIGGLERIFVEKMNYLAEKLHHEVYLITASQGNHPFSFPLSKQVKHIDLNISFHSQFKYAYPQRIWIQQKLNKLFKTRLQETIELINPNFIICTTAWKPEVICRLKCKAKKIVEAHCAKDWTAIPETFTYGFIKDLWNKYLVRKRFSIVERFSDAVVTLTQADAKAWSKAIKVYTIPDFTQITSSQNNTYETPRVIAAGRLSYQKGFDRLIDAWKMVNKDFPEWKLDILGEGIYKDKLNEQIKRHHLEEVITILPFTANIKQEYLNSSIFALSSNYEGFALVLLEARSCGLPSVAFDCPFGPSEIINNKVDGFLIKNGDIEGFAQAICYLIRNKEKRIEMGIKAKQNAQRFSPKEIMSQWNNLFNELK